MAARKGQTHGIRKGMDDECRHPRVDASRMVYRKVIAYRLELLDLLQDMWLRLDGFGRPSCTRTPALIRFQHRRLYGSVK